MNKGALGWISFEAKPEEKVILQYISSENRVATRRTQVRHNGTKHGRRCYERPPNDSVWIVRTESFSLKIVRSEPLSINRFKYGRTHSLSSSTYLVGLIRLKLKHSMNGQCRVGEHVDQFSSLEVENGVDEWRTLCELRWHFGIVSELLASTLDGRFSLAKDVWKFSDTERSPPHT